MPDQITLAHRVPLSSWLVWLADGWTFATLPEVKPMAGNHGYYAVLMIKDA